jgi:hypothetical protein
MLPTPTSRVGERPTVSGMAFLVLRAGAPWQAIVYDLLTINGHLTKQHLITKQHLGRDMVAEMQRVCKISI